MFHRSCCCCKKEPLAQLPLMLLIIAMLGVLIILQLLGQGRKRRRKRSIWDTSNFMLGVVFGPDSGPLLPNFDEEDLDAYDSLTVRIVQGIRILQSRLEGPAFEKGKLYVHRLQSHPSQFCMCRRK